MELEFSQQIFEKHSNVKFMKICPVETDTFHAVDRKTWQS